MDERRLRKFFGFTEQDLLANRRGQFSEAQMKRFSTQAKAERAAARSSAATLFVIAAAGLAIGLGIGSVAPPSTGRILILLSMGIVWPLAWAGKGLQILRAARALQEPQLRQVSGQARILRHADGTYVLKIGDHEFDLDRHPSGAIVEGDEYRLYFAEGTGDILSIEYPLPKKE
jgi:hypothetical protein